LIEKSDELTLRKADADRVAFNSGMRSKCLSLICVLLVLFFQMAAAASVSSMSHSCCGSLISSTDAVAAAHCCGERQVVQASSGCRACVDGVSSITTTHDDETPSCSSCSGDCAGGAWPIVFVETVAVSIEAMPFLPVGLHVPLNISQTSHRIERPPRIVLS